MILGCRKTWALETVIWGLKKRLSHGLKESEWMKCSCFGPYDGKLVLLAARRLQQQSQLHWAQLTHDNTGWNGLIHGDIISPFFISFHIISLQFYIFYLIFLKINCKGHWGVEDMSHRCSGKQCQRIRLPIPNIWNKSTLNDLFLPSAGRQYNRVRHLSYWEILPSAKKTYQQIVSGSLNYKSNLAAGSVSVCSVLVLVCWYIKTICVGQQQFVLLFVGVCWHILFYCCRGFYCFTSLSAPADVIQRFSA